MRIEPFLQATADQKAAALGRLSEILHGGATAPEPAVLRAIATHLFRDPEARPGDATMPLPPALARPIAELALLMPLMDQAIDPQKVERAAQVIAALGQPQPQIGLLRHAAAGRLARLRLQVADPLVRQLAGCGVAGALAAVARTRLGLDRGHARQLRQPRAPGTLGAELQRYYADNPFELPGETRGMPPVLVGRHDYVHVLTGYDTSTEGELCLAGFVGGCGQPTRLEAMLTCVLQFQQAIPVQEFTKEVVTRGALRPDSFFLAVARGAACKADIADPGLDYMAWLDRDLAGLRAELGIGPEGMMVHAGQPRWAVAGSQAVLAGQARRPAPPQSQRSGSA